MDFLEIIRRCRRRILETYSSSFCRNRKVLVLLVVVFPFLYYIWSRLMLTMYPSRGLWDDHPAIHMLELSVENRLIPFYKREVDLSANIQHEPLRPYEHSYLPFVGNGLFGVVAAQESVLYLRKDRVLTLPVTYRPIVNVEFELAVKSAKVTDYVSGIAYSVSCYMNDICVTSQYYAHRTLPNIFVQDIEVVNPANYNAKVYLSRESFDQDSWPQVEIGSLRLKKSDVGSRNASEDYETLVGPLSNDLDEFFVSIIAMRFSTQFYVPPKSKYSWQSLVAVCESERNLPATTDRSQLNTELHSFCVKQLKTALKRTPGKLREDHTNVWKQSWNTGISISYSKAKDALNGDKINATMYYVLSNVRSLLHEEVVDEQAQAQVQAQSLAALSNIHGCYGNIHHTFQATNLWGDLSTFFSIQKAAASWLLTLQKQGCDGLVALGALGVMQAMVLSFGSFRFTSQHLEFNMHPKFLHRDYTFRRLQYGNFTQINVTVQLQEDNKAILLVALDKSDRPFYACDGGCLDGPVQLGNMKMQFPVKLTEPVTAILYISPDKKHLDDLRHAIHVHEVGEAPAHEHGVIALHKHGHHLGGLPTLFWVSVGFLITVFHLFLFKLIYNEYCGSYQERRTFQNNQKFRYSKL